jgi:hypothetical protein
MALTKAPLFAEAQARGMLSIACTVREEQLDSDERADKAFTAGLNF